MSAEESAQDLNSQDWFQPGTYSVWVWDRSYAQDEGCDGEPIFLVLYEWEIAGLRGLQLVEAWGSLVALLKRPDGECDSDYERLKDEASEPTDMTSKQLAEQVKSGELRRVGPMPKLQWCEQDYATGKVLPNNAVS